MLYNNMNTSCELDRLYYVLKQRMNVYVGTHFNISFPQRPFVNTSRRRSKIGRARNANIENEARINKPATGNRQSRITESCRIVRLQESN